MRQKNRRTNTTSLRCAILITAVRKKIKWNGLQTKKIALDKNSRYQITVEPYAVKYNDAFTMYGPAFNPYPWALFPFKCWAPRAWVNNCSWKVASYSQVKSCK